MAREEEEEEEVKMEAEAVRAVYEDDCVILDSFPPHLTVHIRPRTADVSSQQFVEAVIGIQAGSQYPKEPPHIYLVESKGLDERRQQHLITSIQDKADELSSCLMLVALCEEAVEKLSILNHPDGDCPLCLYPLVPEDEQNETSSFMKLMSCYHCFHSECIIRWWKWLHKENKSKTSTSTTTIQQPVSHMESWNENMNEIMGESIGNCPVCRKVFQAKDIEHVLDLVGTSSCKLSSEETELDDDKELLQSDSENARRLKFESILKLQEANSGLIEPKKDIVVVPGMFLPQPVALPSQPSNEETPEQHQRVNTEVNSGSSSNRPGNNVQRSSSRRKHNRVQNHRKQVRQWVVKENGNAN
ncbi:hypothetical protein K2173_011317 [Erythroxylum novogranatense]|uniref:E3 ubiquitin-protein ligase RNF25 n=1 Tax=Erythroxylum novogranatense TaxID=1862640 RepID=A0AAV8S995_9ROSI|nr:hypothetical protein K2173_011317 [Erythroxylum novogranatense]